MGLAPLLAASGLLFGSLLPATAQEEKPKRIYLGNDDHTDLLWTADEAESFLNDVMGLQLEPALVDAVEARTEGWPAGLQLAALSTRTRGGGADGSRDVAELVEGFSGSHRFVLDYLVEEVLDRQPDDMRAFNGSFSP